MFTLRLSMLVISALLAKAEVIYDNTGFVLGGFASEQVEYGDQVDLEGTARTLTELTYFYYGDFVADGNEAMRVRLYSNETPYDLYRNAPTRVLYQSGFMPFSPGYGTQTLSNLNVKLPLDTVTFTVEFKGLKTNESAGLLFYGPPTVGASFNEFWRRDSNNPQRWNPFYYSLTDPAWKANAGLRLTARADADVTSAQNDRSAALAMRTATNSLRFAQTFSPEASGRLDTVRLSLQWQGLPVQLSIRDTQNGRPGTNILAGVTVTNSADVAGVTFYDQQIYLVAGELYALECRTDSGLTGNPDYILSCSTADQYAGGQLWAAAEPDSLWQPAFLPTGETNIDASFSVAVVPAAPPVRITSPAVGETIPAGKGVRFAVDLNLPRISQLWRVRFFDGDTEIQELVNPPASKPPYEIFWQTTNTGPHKLKAIVEDGFRRPFRTEPRLVHVVTPPPSIARLASIERKTEGGMVLKFDTLATERVRVQYSDDLEHWKPAAVEVVGTGLEVSYEDDGPPKTDRHPKDTPQRYYRVLFGE